MKKYKFLKLVDSNEIPNWEEILKNGKLYDSNVDEYGDVMILYNEKIYQFFFDWDHIVRDMTIEVEYHPLDDFQEFPLGLSVDWKFNEEVLNNKVIEYDDNTGETYAEYTLSDAEKTQIIDGFAKYQKIFIKNFEEDLKSYADDHKYDNNAPDTYDGGPV